MGYVPPFSLVSGSQYGCDVISNGRAPGSCITTGQGDYAANAHCSFAVAYPVRLEVVSFSAVPCTDSWSCEFEGPGDGLYVNRRFFTGSMEQTGPQLDGLLVEGGSFMTWVSDFGHQSTGFVLCVAANGTGLPLPPTPPPTSAAPTADGYVSPFVVASGAQYGCSLTSHGGSPGSCISDGVGEYGVSERCTFTAVRSVRLVVLEFDTARIHDTLTVNGSAYSGTISQVGPSLDGVIVSTGSVITWASQYCSNSAGTDCFTKRGHSGFVLCDAAGGRSFQPTAASYVPPFFLVNGTSSGCAVVSNGGAPGSCITNGATDATTAACSFSTNIAVRLVALDIITATVNDGLTVNGRTYTGASAQSNVNGLAVPAGSTITWTAVHIQREFGEDDDVEHPRNDDQDFVQRTSVFFLVCAAARGTGHSLAPTAPTTSPTSAAPTADGFVPPFVLASGSEYGCAVTSCMDPTSCGEAPGACITDGTGDFGIWQRCTLSVQRTVRTVLLSFTTETYPQRESGLWVNGFQYGGPCCPSCDCSGHSGSDLNGVQMRAGTRIDWATDIAGPTTGFVLCALLPTEMGFTLPPTPAPLTLEPTAAGHIPPATTQYYISGCSGQQGFGIADDEGMWDELLLYGVRSVVVPSAPFFAYECWEGNITTEAIPNPIHPSTALFSLSNNMITSLEVGLFANLPFLMLVFLDNNMITSIEVGVFSNLPRLGILWLQNNRITSLQAGVFDNAPNIGILWIFENALTHIEIGAFANMASLIELSLWGNKLASLDVGVFDNKPALFNLDLSDNLLTSLNVDLFPDLRSLTTLELDCYIDHTGARGIAALEAGVFANTGALKDLTIVGCSLTLLEAGVFTLPELVSLQLASNKLSWLAVGVFSHMTMLKWLDLEHNMLTALHADVFANNHVLEVLYLSSNSITTLPRTLLSGLGRLTTLGLSNNAIASFPIAMYDTMRSIPSLVISNNPLQCTRQGHGTTIVCSSCTLGYTFTGVSQEISCDFLAFGPAPSLQWNITDRTSVFGSPQAPSTLYVGSSYHEAAPQLSPKLSAFVGYVGSFAAIEYDARIRSQDSINISCDQAGHIVTGSTEGAPPSRHKVFNPYTCHADSSLDMWDDQCAGAEYMYDSPEVTHTFQVASGGGVFTFDSCLSSFPTSLAVYRLNPDDASAAPVLVFPNHTRTIVLQPGGRETIQIDITTWFPHVGGCGNLSLNARTPPIYLREPGLYAVCLQAGQVWDRTSLAVGSQRSGKYVLNMTCGSADETVPSAAARLGLQVDRLTGATSANPNTPGNYSIDLMAIDAGGAGATTTIRQWSFSVEPPPLFRRTAAPFVFQPPIPVTRMLALDWTYVFWPPSDSNNTLRYFDGVVGGSPVTFSVVAAHNDDRVVSIGDDALVSSQSGLIQVVPRQPGNYSLYVVASDGTRYVNVTGDTPWRFEVLPANGAWNDVNGPNGRGCGDGSPVESLFHNGSFTCDCTFAVGMTGANCDLSRVSIRRTPVPFVYSPPIPETTRLATGWTYTFHSPISAGAVDDSVYFANVSGSSITFSVEVSNSSVTNLADVLLVNTQTGLINIVPGVNGNYTVSVIAADDTGRTSVFGSPWVFEVMPPGLPWNYPNGPNGNGCGSGVPVQTSANNGSYTCDCSGTVMSGPNCDVVRDAFQRTAASFDYDPPIPTTTSLALGWTYTFKPPQDSTDATVYFANVDGVVGYSAVVANTSVDVLSEGLLVNPRTGLIEIIPQVLGNYTLSVVASDASSGRANVTGSTPWRFEVLPANGAWNDVNGPNGHGCGDGSPVESLFHNGSFTCDCTSAVGMSGTNCDEVVAFSSMDSSSSSNQSVLVSLLSIFVAIVLVGYGWHRLRMRKRQWTPINFAAEADKLLAQLGLGPQFDIAVDQIGFALTLSGLAADVGSGNAVLTLQDEDDLRVTLARAFRSTRFTGITNSSIDWASATVRLAVPERAEVAVVVQRPALDSSMKGASIADRVLDRLQRAIQAGRLVLRQDQSGTVAVTSVALMVPKRVPREVDRKTVTRLGERLGEGVSAEVFKATVTARSGTATPMLVASKEPRSDGKMTREDVEREAVLMALLEHPNVLKLVGVVTVPRTMPALMLLEYCEHGSLEIYLREQSTDAIYLRATGGLTMALRLSFCVDIADGMDYLASRRVVHRDVSKILLVCIQ